MTNSIDPSLYLSSLQNDAAKRNTDSILGKDDFLKILMVQLQNQDPTSPMQDREFIAQMATFSSLEQMTNMSKAIESLVQLEQKNQLIEYTPYIGKEVAWKQVYIKEDGSVDKILEGVGIISSVSGKTGELELILNDGTSIYPEEIVHINAQTDENQLLQASQLIGKQVIYLDDQDQQIHAGVESVSFKNGKSEFQLNNGTNITAKDIIGVSQ